MSRRGSPFSLTDIRITIDPADENLFYSMLSKAGNFPEVVDVPPIMY